MADSLGVRLSGERRVALRFEQFPEVARTALLDVVTRYQGALQDGVASKIPAGTGKLLASLSGGVENNPKKIRGWVNVGGKDRNLILEAMALEYGSHRPPKSMEVRGYTTTTGRIVSAYKRGTNIMAQMFLRGPLASMSETFLDDAEKALEQATQAA